MTDWLIRTEMLIGVDGMKRLHGSDVLVVGLGGVGAYAAETICRAGVGRMTIIDSDTVNPSNRNRQLPALKSTEGIPKTEVVGKRLRDINPDLELTEIQEFIKDERIIAVLDRKYDYVVDAIDTLSPKIFLIYNSLKKGYPVVSSMGAGGKFDPGMVSIGDISETESCPLARILRKKLHGLGIREGVTAVWSPETVDKNKVVESKAEPNKASVVGTISYMPAAFGIACASVVIRDLAGIPR
jgi:tRNA A37 threonylcarbamoyladenosine dehydratase